MGIGIIQTNVEKLRATLAGITKDIERVKEAKAEETAPVSAAVATQRAILSSTGELESPAETMKTLLPSQIKTRLDEYVGEVPETVIEASISPWAKRGAEAYQEETGDTDIVDGLSATEWIEKLRQEQLQLQQEQFLDLQQLLTEQFKLRTEPEAPVTPVTVEAPVTPVIPFTFPDITMPDVDLLGDLGDLGKYALIGGAILIGAILLTRK